VALASRDPERAREMAGRHGVPRVHPGYEELLGDPDVEAVYLPLANSLHRPWTIRALEAGKHVLCEKPLALGAGEAREMTAAAEASGRLLMEALMYRFHPRMQRLREECSDVRYLHATFAFPLDAPGNYRLLPQMGGGALLDVGSYTISAARWFLGEPQSVQARVWVDRAGERRGVDMSVTALLGFSGGVTAATWASFAAPEQQELLLITSSGVRRVEQPFTAWRDPDDPYQLMVEAFAEAALRGDPAPHPPSDSIANLMVLDAVRGAAGLVAP
jgi:predicted dehydrogenase